MITSGIGAGSPDLDSPDACGGLEGYDGDHIEKDVDPWKEIPCYQYLAEWPANNNFACTNNPKTDIQHMLTLVGEMNCEQVTELFMAVDENLDETTQLRRYFHQEWVGFYPNSQIIVDLIALRTTMGCDDLFSPDGCEEIQLAIDNLQ